MPPRRRSRLSTRYDDDDDDDDDDDEDCDYDDYDACEKSDD